MAKMVAIGAERFTLVFGALGFEPRPAEPAEFLGTLEAVLEDRNVGLVVCGESLLSDHAVPDFRELCREGAAAVVLLPDRPEPAGTGRELIRRSIEAAAGVDLLSSVQEHEEDSE
ncbi:MAG: V-type ATP synthase subunit F [Planctomycetota bacterium]